ncbi:acyl carrier protein [Streptomyces rimosus]|uniref:acyl carrier protein n=1 Tax=Streptomyces rimosus TaxID=1927 RepID=UPI0031DBFF02
MSTNPFTLADLKKILLEGAGAPEGVDLDADILDIEFAALGYDSLAILETVGRVEREYGIPTDDSILAEATTPRAFLDAANARS